MVASARPTATCSACSPRRPRWRWTTRSGRRGWSARSSERTRRSSNERRARAGGDQRIQHGLAAELDFQAIVDLVGEKLREVFSADVTGIALLDRERDLLSYPFLVDHGERFRPPPQPDGSPRRRRRVRDAHAADNRHPHGGRARCDVSQRIGEQVGAARRDDPRQFVRLRAAAGRRPGDRPDLHRQAARARVQRR